MPSRRCTAPCWPARRGPCASTSRRKPRTAAMSNDRRSAKSPKQTSPPPLNGNWRDWPAAARARLLDRLKRTAKVAEIDWQRVGRAVAGELQAEDLLTDQERSFVAEFGNV